MQKQLGILIALILIGIGGYYVFTERVAETPAPVATTTPIATENLQNGDDQGESPYTEPDPKLHISKEVTLDPKIITINNELKDITLCGNTYKTKQVVIDGVDAVQRLAQLLTKDQEMNDWYCDILKIKVTGANSVLPAGEEVHIIINQNGANYAFALYIGTYVSGGEGGHPIYILPKENKLMSYSGYIFGTLR
jgi:hypothetical protein